MMLLLYHRFQGLSIGNVKNSHMWIGYLDICAGDDYTICVADITLVALTYRSLGWLNWCMEGVGRADTSTSYRWLVVANDAEDEVIGGLQDADYDWIDHRNDNPGEYYINRVYRAWNRGVLEARTQYVVMLNSDMWPSANWLDALAWAKKTEPKSVPTSLLVESGRIPSAMPETVRNFGVTPEMFDSAGFSAYADTIRVPGCYEPGRLYMPILVDRQEFLDIGGYPAGNPVGTTGDKDLIRRYKAAGFKHTTVMGSVVYHAQEGETRWP